MFLRRRALFCVSFSSPGKPMANGANPLAEGIFHLSSTLRGYGRIAGALDPGRLIRDVERELETDRQHLESVARTFRGLVANAPEEIFEHHEKDRLLGWIHHLIEALGSGPAATVPPAPAPVATRE